jgi:hypothetical protein
MRSLLSIVKGKDPDWEAAALRFVVAEVGLPSSAYQNSLGCSNRAETLVLGRE